MDIDESVCSELQKHFRQKETTPLPLSFTIQQGFTILTGANGSGKSNILEAITFGLGEIPRNLRVTKLDDISCDETGKVHGKTVVELTFHCLEEQSLTIIGSSIVDNQRLYYVASKKVTKRNFEQFVQGTLGFSNERSCYNIKQHAAQDLIRATPKQLFSFLCEAAGTQTVLAARDEARFQINHARNSLDSVLATIREFEIEVVQDTRLREIIVQMRDTKYQLRQVLEDVKKSRYLNNLSELYGTLHSLWEALVKKNQADTDMLSWEEKLRDAKELCCDASRAAGEHDPDMLAYQSLTSLLDFELRVQLHHSQKLHAAALDKKAHFSELQEKLVQYVGVTEKRMSIVQLQLTMLASELSNGHKDMCYWENQLKNKCEFDVSVPLAGGDHKVDFIRQKIKLQAALQQRNTDFMDLTSRCLVLSAQEASQAAAAKHLEEFALQAEERVNELKFSLNNGTEERCDDWLSCGENDMISREHDLNSTRRAQSDIQSQLASAKEERSHFRRHKLKLLLDADIGEFGDHDHGCLADVLFVSVPPDLMNCPNEEDSDWELMQGLQHIVGPSLGVRLCSTQHQAIDLMSQFERSKLNSANGCNSLRIWPLDALRTSCERSPLFLSIISSCESSSLRTGAWQVLDPATCLSASCPSFLTAESISFQKALYKSCQSWILTASDNIAKDIMEKVVAYQKQGGQVNIGCMTVSGNRHTVGGLTISSNDDCKQVSAHISHNRPRPPVAYLNEYRNLNQQIQNYQKQLDAYDITLKEKSNSYFHLAELIQATKQVNELRSDLFAAKNVLDATQHTLEALTLERELQQRFLTKSSNHLNEITEILSAMDVDGGCDNSVEVASYNSKQFRLCQDSLRLIEENVCELEVEKRSLMSNLEDAQEKKKDLILDQEENKSLVVKLNKNIIAFQQRIFETEQQIAMTDISKLEKERAEKQHLLENLHSRVDGLEAAKSESEDIVTSSIECCAKLASEYMCQVSSLDAEDKNEKHGRRERRRVEKMKSKLTVQRESDLFNKAIVMTHSEQILEEVRRSFSDGSILAQHLESDCSSFMHSVSSEMNALNAHKDQLTSRWRTLLREFSALDRSQQKQKHNCQKNMLKSNNRVMDRRAKGTLNYNLQNDIEDDNEQNDWQDDQDDFDPIATDLKLEEHAVLMDQRKVLLESFQSKFHQITAAIGVLEDGLDELHEQLKQTHCEVYEKIRRRFSDYFDDMVRLKDTTCDLECIVTSDLQYDCDAPDLFKATDLLENGFRIVLKPSSPLRGKAGGARAEKKGEHEDERGVGAGVQGLSGGQQALLGLALVFSCALSSQPSPVYFLDEVDSSLDEANQNALAQAVANIFMDTKQQQVICVSHNKNFQKHTTNRISVQMKDGHTIIV